MTLHLKGYGSLDDLALPLREAAGERPKGGRKHNTPA